MNILQRRINCAFMAARRKGKACRVIGLKPRKRGFSTMVAGINYTELCKHNFESVIVGNSRETSGTVFKMIDVFSKNDGLAGKWGSQVRPLTESMHWAHGSILNIATARNGDSIRGQTPQFVHGTEVAHWQNQEEVFVALMNAIPDDPLTSVFLESTPKGASGAYHQRWQEARWPTADECPDGKEYWRYWETHCPDQTDDSLAEYDFVRVFAAWFEFEEARTPLTQKAKDNIRDTLDSVPWYHGERDLIKEYGETYRRGGKEVQRLGREVVDCDIWEQLSWRRMILKTKCNMDPRQFDQEYPRDPDSCFLASGSAYFDADCITEYRQDVTAKCDKITLARAEGQERVTWRVCPDDEATVLRWEEPKYGCSYLIVVDTAEGEDQTTGLDPDRHSALVLRRPYRDAQTRVLHKARVVARVRTPCHVPIYALNQQVDMLSRYYGRCLVIPEMNSSGLAFVTVAQLLQTPIWQRVEFNHRDGKEEKKLGWRTTDNADYSGVRTLILSNLHKVLRDRDIDIHCPNIVYELSKFARVDGKLQGDGAHDDDVMAIAIGLYNIEAATLYEEPVRVRTMPRDLMELMGRDDSGEAGLSMRT